MRIFFMQMKKKDTKRNTYTLKYVFEVPHFQHFFSEKNGKTMRKSFISIYYSLKINRFDKTCICLMRFCGFGPNSVVGLCIEHII